MGSRLESSSKAVLKRIENHTFEDEEGEEYQGSKFGGFPEYFKRKQVKLQNLDAELRSQTRDNPPIFRGVVAHVNGYTQPSLNDLHKMIVSYGGGFMQYLDGKTAVTHIIASNLTPKKAVEFRKYRIVKPAWVVESVKAGRLLPWDAFRLLDEGAGQKILGFDNGKVVSEANIQSRSYKDQTEGSWYTSQLRAGDGLSHHSSWSPSTQRPPTPEEEDQISNSPPSFQPELEGPAACNQTMESASTALAPPTTSPVQGGDKQKSWMSSGYEERRHTLKRSRESEPDDPIKRTKLTAEEHNAILLADPHIRKSTVIDPQFLEQYYRESRLHHLSTWKADLKAQLQTMTAEKTSSQKARQKRVPGMRRYILHVDFDSFFAAVSLKKHPQYKDKPAVVAHGGGSGSEVASCNYPARKFGIKNGMWMKRAQDLCPELHVLPYDFAAYEEASREFYDAILSIGGIVQSVSVDEALVDISTLCLATGGSDGKKLSEGSIYREQAKADQIAQSIREQVKVKTGCDVSVGIGGNILLAKIALRKAKPAGQYQIKPEEILDVLGKLEVQALPGVAASIAGKLEDIGIKYIGDIREFSRERLVNTLGPKTGDKIWNYSRGIDRTEVGNEVVRKSVSVEISWGVRFQDQGQVDEFIESLCGELSKRLRKENVKGRQLTLKIMRRAPDAPLDPPKHLGHGKCNTYNKSIVFGVATNAPDVLRKETLSMLKGFGFSPGELRGIGVHVTKLEPVKAVAEGWAESSQRRLQFKTSAAARPADEQPENLLQDDIETPKKPKIQPGQIAFGAEQLNSGSPSRKPLNTLGTQFILPTQIDSEILDELPEEIRAKLAKHVQSASHQTLGLSDSNRGSGIKGVPLSLTALPNHSQLDPEILAALPSDVRSEVLAFYQNSPCRRKGEQSFLPQSPRKNRTVAPTKKPQPLPRKRGRPPKADISRDSNNATLTQSNFIAPRFTRRPSQDFGNGGTTPTTTDAEASDAGEPNVAEEVSPDFLAALPEEIRREVIAEQRRMRLKPSRGLNLAQSSRQKVITRVADASNSVEDDTPGSDTQEGDPGTMQRFLHLPPRPPRPTFTTQKLYALPDLREALRRWWEEFQREGPYKEDVDALAGYLEKVVGEERDLGKSVAVVRWMGWLLEEGFDAHNVMVHNVDMARKKWEDAFDQVKTGVLTAVRRRGLGDVDF